VKGRAATLSLNRVKVVLNKVLKASTLKIRLINQINTPFTSKAFEGKLPLDILTPLKKCIFSLALSSKLYILSALFLYYRIYIVYILLLNQYYCRKGKYELII